jgi:hypothetical protein
LTPAFLITLKSFSPSFCLIWPTGKPSSPFMNRSVASKSSVFGNERSRSRDTVGRRGTMSADGSLASSEIVEGRWGVEVEGEVDIEIVADRTQKSDRVRRRELYCYAR